MNSRNPVKPIPTHPRVAVFGASGFIGRNVANALRGRGAVVKPVQTPRLSSPAAYDQASQTITECLEGVDVVVNAAGIAAPEASNTSLWAANSEVPRLLANACQELGIRFVHVSSAAVLGAAPIIDSRQSTRPFSPYSRSKAAGERNAQTWAGSVVYRPAGVHGEHRATTASLARLARSPLSSVADTGEATSPQALVENAADAIAFLATTQKQPPAIVHHPAEPITTADLLSALGGHEPVHLAGPLSRALVRTVALAGRLSPRLAATARRMDVLWHGQTIAPSWLEAAGWAPPAGIEGWRALGARLRGRKAPSVVFGVTSGVSAPPFFTGLFRHLATHGWTVNLVSSTDGNVREFLQEEGATLLPVPSTRQPSPLTDTRTLAQVISHLCRHQPDVAVWGTPKMGLLGVLASRITRTPCIYVVHGLRYQGATGLRRTLLRLIEAVPVAMATEVLAVGNDVKRCLETDHVARRGKVQVIASGSANGVLPSELSPAVQTHEAPIKAAFVGRLTRDKGLADMLEAWALVRKSAPDATLHLYGRREDDTQHGPLADLLDASEGVIEHGFVADPLTIYPNTQMLLLPTRREGLPTVVLEAAAAGVPTIASDIPGAREPIRHGETGLLIPPRSPDSLASAILALGNNSSLRCRMGLAAREHTLDTYLREDVHIFWSNFLTKYHAHYQTRAGLPLA